MAAFVQLEKECCQLKDVDSIQRNNNAYKGTSNSSRGRLSTVCVCNESLSSPFLKGHNKAVSQRVSQSGRRPLCDALGLGRSPLVDAPDLTRALSYAR